MCEALPPILRGEIYRGIVVYWYLGVEVYRCIDVFGGFRGDLGYRNIDILVPWGVVKHG